MDHPFTYDPNQPPRTVRFEAIGDAWKIIWSDVATWVLASLAWFAAMMAVFVPIYLAVVLLFASLFSGSANHTSASPGASALVIVLAICLYVVMLVLITIVGGLSMASLMRFGLLRVRGGAPTFNDLFVFDGMAWQVILLQVLVSLSIAVVVGIPTMILVGGGIALLHTAPVLGVSMMVLGYVVAIGASIVIQTHLLLAPLIIVDQKLSAIEAAKLSAKTLRGQTLLLFGVYFCAAILGALGELACFVGVLVTMPIPYVTLAVIYNDFFRLPPPETPGEYATPTQW